MIQLWRAFCRGLDRLDSLTTRLAAFAWDKIVALYGRTHSLIAPTARRTFRITAAATRTVVGRGILPTARWACAHSPLRTVPVGLALFVALTAWNLHRSSSAHMLRMIGIPAELTAALLVDIPVLGLLITISRLAGLVAWVAVVAAVAALLKKQLALWLLKSTAAAFALLVLLVQYVVTLVPSVLHAMDRDAYPTMLRNEAWVTSSLRLLPFGLLAILFLFVLVLRRVTHLYTTRDTDEPATGDRIWLNLRGHGSDPCFRKSSYVSALLHIFFILILPFLLTIGGCMQSPYEIPKGSGTPAIQVITVRKVQKKEIEKKYVFSPETAISMYVPKIDESRVFQEVEKLTEHTYEAQDIGRLGAGGGKQGGWPDGMENARVRFIRLQYSGQGWDHNMGYGADYNMLLVFRELTGFHIWQKTEAIRIPQLKRFPRNRAPPFVYMTGGPGTTMNLSGAEITALREYCIDMGGMIFADNGGAGFDAHFRRIVNQAFPNLPLREISHDDVIFRQPFVFRDGAPPLWHISGTQALGIKHQGRWIVFYHQGHMGAAWRDGHSDANQSVVGEAYRMGVNVINYAFNQYTRINFGGKIER